MMEFAVVSSFGLLVIVACGLFWQVLLGSQIQSAVDMVNSWRKG